LEDRVEAIARWLCKKRKDRHPSDFHPGIEYEFRDRDEERYHPQPEPSSGFAGCWVSRGIEPEPPLESRPAQVAFLSKDDDHGEDEQPDQTQCE